MESITIKVEKDMADAINSALKPFYATKTEFIREAIRDKLKQRALQKLSENFGKGKKTTKLTDRQVRELVGKEYFKKHGF
jgi:metal-responsive CopG/Arc/MetJ family transcriptional regulator